jgi:hypothetical protein
MTQDNRTVAKPAFRKSIVFVAVLLVAAGGTGLWWLAGRVDRASFALLYGSEQERVEAMRLLADHADNPEAFQIVVDWFKSEAHGNPVPELMAEASRAFAGRKPTDDGFPAAVAAFQVRGLFPETRTWVDDYEHAPAITAALLAHLVTSIPSGWQGADANLQRELSARPKDAVTLDLAIAVWRQGRLPATVKFIETFDTALTEARVKASASTPAQGLDEWRLLACQYGRCRSADVGHIINSARADSATVPTQLRRAFDASFRLPSPSSSLERLDAQRTALVSLGGPAVPALVALYDDPSSVMSSFAVATLAEIDESAFVSRLAPEVRKVGAPALKAIDALQATPHDSHGANHLLMEALSSKAMEISDAALGALRRRLSEQELVDGVLGYVADRDRFSQREVMAYEDAIKSAGPKAGTYVADTMTRMLDEAGDPRGVVWIQKVLALHVLRDVGTQDALSVLGRLRRDPGGYVWVTTTTTDGRTSESHRDVPFRQASDEAIEAINHRGPNS